MDKNQTQDIQHNDEIDLVDIISVLIKRRWTILIVLFLSILISGAYVKFIKSKSVNYTSQLKISLPEKVEIGGNYILDTSSTSPRNFIDMFSIKLNQFKIEKGYNTNVTINFDKKTGRINISISDKDKINLGKVLQFTYNFYKEFSSKVNERNKNILNVTQDSLEQELKQKKAILDTLIQELNNKNLNSKLSGAIVYVIDYLSDSISKIKRIMLLNKNIIYNEGKIEVVSDSNSLILTDATISNINKYIKSSISKKRTLLPVIVSVFLALFLGIFLAFAIEFFSREDVKKRLKEASKK